MSYIFSTRRLINKRPIKPRIPMPSSRLLFIPRACRSSELADDQHLYNASEENEDVYAIPSPNEGTAIPLNHCPPVLATQSGGEEI